MQGARPSGGRSRHSGIPLLLAPHRSGEKQRAGLCSNCVRSVIHPVCCPCLTNCLLVCLLACLSVCHLQSYGHLICCDRSRWACIQPLDLTVVIRAARNTWIQASKRDIQERHLRVVGLEQRGCVHNLTVGNLHKHDAATVIAVRDGHSDSAARRI
jgi:hypothetical protein